MGHPLLTRKGILSAKRGKDDRSAPWERWRRLQAASAGLGTSVMLASGLLASGVVEHLGAGVTAIAAESPSTWERPARRELRDHANIGLSTIVTGAAGTDPVEQYSEPSYEIATAIRWHQPAPTSEKEAAESTANQPGEVARESALPRWTPEATVEAQGVYIPEDWPDVKGGTGASDAPLLATHCEPAMPVAAPPAERLIDAFLRGWRYGELAPDERLGEDGARQALADFSDGACDERVRPLLEVLIERFFDEMLAESAGDVGGEGTASSRGQAGNASPRAEQFPPGVMTEEEGQEPESSGGTATAPEEEWPPGLKPPDQPPPGVDVSDGTAGTGEDGKEGAGVASNPFTAGEGKTEAALGDAGAPSLPPIEPASAEGGISMLDTNGTGQVEQPMGGIWRWASGGVQVLAPTEHGGFETRWIGETPWWGTSDSLRSDEPFSDRLTEGEIVTHSLDDDCPGSGCDCPNTHWREPAIFKKGDEANSFWFTWLGKTHDIETCELNTDEEGDWDDWEKVTRQQYTSFVPIRPGKFIGLTAIAGQGFYSAVARFAVKDPDLVPWIGDHAIKAEGQVVQLGFDARKVHLVYDFIVNQPGRYDIRVRFADPEDVLGDSVHEEILRVIFPSIPGL